MPHHIRDAVRADAGLILDLIQELADYERMSEEVTATPEAIASSLFPADGRQPAAHCVIAEVDDAAVGFALFFFNYSTFLAKPGLYLEDLFVRSSFRGRGIGKALFLHLAAIAHARGCGRMEWAVLDWNTPALQFYEAMGAHQVREWQICRLTADTLARLARP